jgi:hypothetical protein
MSFTVDLDPPTSSLVHSLSPFVNYSSVSVDVSASDALSLLTRYSRIDGGVWEAVGATNRTTYVLGDGPHIIECWSVDAAGNAQPPPLSNVSFVVDTVRPLLSVATPPSEFNTLSAVNVSVSVTDATATSVRGVLDGSVAVATRVGSGSVSVGVATDGNHTLVLSGVDAAGMLCCRGTRTVLRP